MAAPATWDAAARLGSDDAAGEWSDGKFEVDLTRNIHEAAQFRVRFIGDRARVSGIVDVQLLVGGAPEPSLIRLNPAAKNELILTMTEIGQRVVVRGKVEGAERGTILLQKL